MGLPPIRNRSVTEGGSGMVKLYQKQVSKVTLHFVSGHLSLKNNTLLVKINKNTLRVSYHT